MTKPLEGLTVLEFSQFLSGPYAGLRLADLGARVIKIERPEVGDLCRNLYISDTDLEGDSTLFHAINRNKESFAANLKDAKDIELVKKLIAKADIITQNFRPVVIEKIGLDYESVKKLNPSIIYTVISGFGSKGPKAADPAYDGAIQAASGMMANNGTEESGPLRTGYMGVDLMTGMSAAYATSAALLRKQRTGKGQMVDVAMLDCAIVLQAANFARHVVDDVPDMLIGNQSITGAPTASSFSTKQGSMLSAALMPKHVEAFFDELGIADLLEDPRFSTREARIKNKDVVRAAMLKAFESDTAENWEKRLAPRGVPISKVNSVAETSALEQLQHRNILTDVPAAAGMQRGYRLVGAPFVNSEDGPEPVRSAPTLGQHSREILADLGFDNTAFEILLADCVILESS